MDEKQVLKNDFTRFPFWGHAVYEANIIARDLGLTDSQDIDAFRHAYISAKQAEAVGMQGSGFLLNGYEVFSSRWQNNTPSARGADIINNAYGYQLKHDLDESGLMGEDREYDLRLLIYSRVKDGTLERDRVQKKKNDATCTEVKVRAHERDGYGVRAHTRGCPNK